MGFIQELPDEKYDRKYGDIYLFKRLLKYVGTHDIETLSKVIAFMLIGTASNIGIPYVIKYVIEQVEKSFADPSTNVFTGIFYLVAFTVVLLYGTQWYANYRAQYYTSILMGEMIRTVRRDCYWSLLKQDMTFYDENKSGKLVSRVTSDTETISNMVQLLTNFFINLLVMTSILFILFLTNVTLSLIILAIIPFLFVSAMGVRILARRTSKNWRKTIAILNANVAESISGVEVTKYFNQEEAAFDRFQTINMRNYRAAKYRAIGISVFFPIIQTTFGVGSFLIIYFGSRMAIFDQSIAIADLYFFILMLNRFFMPLLEITQFFNQFEAGLAAVERIFSLIDSEPSVQEIDKPEEIKQVKGEIKFENVEFYYNPDEPLYRHFTLRIKPGEQLALVGKTGSGKSTLVSLIARFYDVRAGKLLIDNVDIKKLRLHNYRDNIGIVLQDNILFSGTIADNIAYGKPHAKQEEIEQAAKNVYAWEFISNLPNGLYTEVGEKGNKLSLGQRQLISFARALLSDPKILIMDEATSAIDAYTESLIQEALKVLLKNRTSIIIAHRLTTVENADRIVVIDNAKIIEQGSHQELMNQKGKYFQLYDMYFRHQSLEYIEQAAEL